MNCAIYDEVWTMDHGQPKKMVVFAVVRSMADCKAGVVETHYRLVESQVGAGWGNNEGMRRDPSDVFLTKDDLLKDFVAEHSK